MCCQGLLESFTVLGGFPFALAGKGFNQGAHVVSNVGTFLGRSSLTNRAGVDVPQGKYVNAVAIVYTDLVSGLDSVTEMLFNGTSINGGFSIINMMSGGA